MCKHSGFSHKADPDAARRAKLEIRSFAPHVGGRGGVGGGDGGV